MTTEALDLDNQVPAPNQRYPHPRYDELSRPEISQQADWFEAAFAETQLEDRAGRQVRGQYYDDILEVLVAAHAATKTIHPNIKGEHFAAETYLSAAAYHLLYSELGIRQFSDFMQIQRTRIAQLRLIGEEVAEASAVTLQPGLLAETPYLFQGDGVRGYDRLRGCFSACFRMAFAAITDEFPHERAVLSGLRRVHGDTIAADEDFLKVFSTPTYRRTFPEHPVSVVTIQGADFPAIQLFTEKIKTKRADVKVYGIVNIQSEVKSNIWHTNTLLSSDEETVTVHDPSSREGLGTPFRRLDRRQFHERWAVAFNRVHLIVAG